MDSTELGCIVAGTLAIGLLSSQAHRTYSKRRHFRGSMRPMSVCSSMRSKMKSALGDGSVNSTQGVASARASQNSMDPNKKVLTDDLDALWEMDDQNKEALDKQLAKEGQRIASRQVKPKMLKPLQEIGTARNADIGGFSHRIGSAEWELDSKVAPTARVSTDCVGLPMGRYMEHQYEKQNGGEMNFKASDDFYTVGPQKATGVIDVDGNGKISRGEFEAYS